MGTHTNMRTQTHADACSGLVYSLSDHAGMPRWEFATEKKGKNATQKVGLHRTRCLMCTAMFERHLHDALKLEKKHHSHPFSDAEMFLSPTLHSFNCFGFCCR